jgi:aminoglycoside phosphotransferase (APT) family kinase protein
VSESYAGILPESDPMHGFLVDEILCDRLSFPRRAYRFHVHRCNDTVVRYTEAETSVSVAVKFYGVKWISGSQTGEPHLRAELMRREFHNLVQARALGLTDRPHRVVRPLATCEALRCALVEEYAAGEDLDFHIRRAVEHGATGELASRVEDIARFLADLHNRSAQTGTSDGGRPVEYLAKLAGELGRWDIITSDQQRELLDIGRSWGASMTLRSPRLVLIHGDATPPQFRFGEDGLTVIDFERMRVSDPAADVGRLAAELKHLLFWYTGDPWAGEPYIRHLYERYMTAVTTPEDFSSLTNRGRFYMGCTQLRISKNHWLDLSYRRRLIEEAKACLAI